MNVTTVAQEAHAAVGCEVHTEDLIRPPIHSDVCLHLLRLHLPSYFQAGKLSFVFFSIAGFLSNLTTGLPDLTSAAPLHYFWKTRRTDLPQSWLQGWSQVIYFLITLDIVNQFFKSKFQIFLCKIYKKCNRVILSFEILTLNRRHLLHAQQKHLLYGAVIPDLSVVNWSLVVS